MSEQNNEKRALVPRLRFPEFRGTGEWELKPLREIAYVLNEKVGNKKLTLLSITSGVGLVSQIEKFGREIAGAQYKNYYVIQRDDFAYNKSSTKDYPEGFIARYQGDEGGAVPNSIFTCFRVDAGASHPPFLNYLFANNLHGKWLRRFITIGARAHGSLNVDDNDLLATPVPVPPKAILLDEQKKIADCLSSLDELIKAETQKLEALKTHKKGLIQQLFPRKGETVPRLRYPEFRNTGAWAKVAAGQFFSNRTERGNSSLPIYSVTMTDGLVPRASLDRRIDDIAETSANKTVRKGDIAYNMMRMWQGALGVAPEDCMVSPAYIVLEPQGVNPFFFYFLLKLPQTLQVLTAHSRGLTEDRLRLYYDDFAKVLLLCPSLPEQERIADCLSSLDDLITVQGQEIDRLKVHKKGLMQQLFPVLDEVPA